MGRFTGFGDVALYYADNYKLVEKMDKMLTRELSALFSDVEDRISSEDWFRKGEVEANRSNYYLIIKFMDDVGKGKYYIALSMSPRELSSEYHERGRHFNINLELPDKYEYTEAVKQAFFDSKDNAELETEYPPSEQHRKKDRFVITRHVSLQTDKVFVQMLDEIGKMRKTAVPILEKALSIAVPSN